MKFNVLCFQRHAVSIGLPLVRISRKTASQQWEQMQKGVVVRFVYPILSLWFIFSIASFLEGQTQYPMKTILTYSQSTANCEL